MTSTIGPIVNKTLANQFRSTFVYGTLNNLLDNTSSSIPARAAFQRDVLVGNNLFLGKGEQDASGNFIDSTSNIQFTLDKAIVSIPVTSLNYINNLLNSIYNFIRKFLIFIFIFFDFTSNKKIINYNYIIF